MCIRDRFGLLVLLLVDLRSLKRSMEADYLAVRRPVRWLILLLLLFSIVIFGSYGAGYDLSLIHIWTSAPPSIFI